MQRRSFIAAGTALALIPAASAQAGFGAEYRPGLVDRELGAGKTVFLDFAASWCTTCRAQERAINALVKENPAYSDSISFISVDWDQYANSDLTKRLNIPRRSTLVVLKGDAEIGRIVAGTSRGQIKGLLDAALNAATA